LSCLAAFRSHLHSVTPTDRRPTTVDDRRAELGDLGYLRERAAQRRREAAHTDVPGRRQFCLDLAEDLEREGDRLEGFRLLKLAQNQSGATAIEYALIAALIAIAAVSAMGMIGTDLSTIFNTIAGKL
jgi:pilus assembly protein Flp/PilA